MVFFLAWLLGCAICSFFANHLNRSAVGVFFGSLFLSPFLVFIFLLFAGKNGKACPKCAETIKHEAKKCMHCGHDFVQAEVDQSIKSISSLLENKIITQDEYDAKRASILKKIG